MNESFGNLFANAQHRGPDELVERLVESAGCTVERIVSHGQATPAGHWYDQPRHEWVVLLSGCAGLRFEDDVVNEMHPGDYVWIPAHRRHRVEWTDSTGPTVWLAVHLSAEF